jgi:hypothetical protein
MLELEWVGSEKGSLDSGTLSVLSLDKNQTKVTGLPFKVQWLLCVPPALGLRIPVVCMWSVLTCFIWLSK